MLLARFATTYRTDYSNHNSISFIPTVVSTSGRLHCDLVHIFVFSRAIGKPSAGIARVVNKMLSKKIETKESTSTSVDGVEVYHNNFVILDTRALFLRTDVGTADTMDGIGRFFEASRVQHAQHNQDQFRFLCAAFHSVVTPSSNLKSASSSPRPPVWWPPAFSS